jgi:glycine/D-amino acid oxidase-like deaminating enzyme
MANFAGLLRDPETWSRSVVLMEHLIDSVYVVRDAITRESLDCDFHLGGMAHVAISPEQLGRAHKAHDLLERAGLEHVHQWLEPDDMDQHVRMANGLGGAYSPHCAVVQPAKLVRGLAHAAERLGVHLFEHSPVTALGPGEVRTAAGAVTARTVILATEGYTNGYSGLPQRRLLPMHSFMTITEPLDARVFDEIGLAGRPAFGDYSWLVTYGQRTPDNRLAFGYGGRTYLDGRPRDVFRPSDRHFRLIQQKLEQQFPTLRGVRYEQSWGGAMGYNRQLSPFVEFDEASRTGWLGGFFGNGVAASNLGARAMADLVLGRDTDLTRLDLLVRRTDLPLRRYKRWELQPMVWSGASATLRSLRRRDREETGV